MPTGTLIGVIGSLVGIIGAIFGIFRNVRTDNDSSGREMGKILSDLGYIKSTLNDISDKVNTQDKRHTDIITRLAILDTFKTTIRDELHAHDDKISAINKEIEKLKAKINTIENK